MLSLAILVLFLLERRRRRLASRKEVLP